jgi:hypothetical protein
MLARRELSILIAFYNVFGIAVCGHLGSWADNPILSLRALISLRPPHSVETYKGSFEIPSLTDGTLVAGGRQNLRLRLDGSPHP